MDKREFRDNLSKIDKSGKDTVLFLELNLPNEPSQVLIADFLEEFKVFLEKNIENHLMLSKILRHFYFNTRKNRIPEHKILREISDFSTAIAGHLILKEPLSEKAILKHKENVLKLIDYIKEIIPEFLANSGNILKAKPILYVFRNNEKLYDLYRKNLYSSYCNLLPFMSPDDLMIAENTSPLPTVILIHSYNVSKLISIVKHDPELMIRFSKDFQKSYQKLGISESEILVNLDNATKRILEKGTTQANITKLNKALFGLKEFLKFFYTKQISFNDMGDIYETVKYFNFN